MKFITGFGIALAVLASANPLLAETREEASSKFGARPSVLDISLSPDGNKIAFIAPSGPSSESVYVVDLAGDASPRRVLFLNDKNAELTHCNWATTDRMVCGAYMISEGMRVDLGFTRTFSVSADGSDVKVLTVDANVRSLNLVQHGGRVLALDYGEGDGEILMTRQWVKESSNGTKISSDREGLGVERVNIESNRRRTLEKAERHAVEYIADENGKVRIKARQVRDPQGYLSSTRTYFYRPLGSKSWEELTTISMTSQTFEGFLPVAVDTEKNIAYGFQSYQGFTALFSMALDGSAELNLVKARPNADVNQLIRIGRKRRVVGASYATEKRVVTYFDPALEKLSSSFSKALPNSPLINIVDSSADENKLLIVASSDTNPGTIYLFDKSQGSIAELLPVRAELQGMVMGEMKPIMFPASDGTEIPGYLTLPPGSDGVGLPTVVLPHGGPSSRDEWGFDWIVQFLTNRGYAVLQPNFRGSDGYGADWFGKNGYRAWQTAVGDVNDAGRWLINEGIANPDQLVVAGWSYGGYAALLTQAMDPSLYKAVVAIAPVTDLEQLKRERDRYTTGSLTESFIGTGPHVTEGSPTTHVDGFASPVMLFHGTKDMNVGVEHSRLLSRRLEQAGKQVEYTEFDDLDHYLDESAARQEMLSKIDRFFSEALAR